MQKRILSSVLDVYQNIFDSHFFDAMAGTATAGENLKPGQSDEVYEGFDMLPAPWASPAC